MNAYVTRSHLRAEFEALGIDPLTARASANDALERLALELEPDELVAYRTLADQLQDDIDLRVATQYGPARIDDLALRTTSTPGRRLLVQ